MLLKIKQVSGLQSSLSSKAESLNDLNDVNASSPSDGDYLRYNNSTGNWDAVSLNLQGIGSIDGISNDGGDIDFISGNAINITPDDVNNQITISETHSTRTDNPHGVTTTQIGAIPTSDLTSNGGTVAEVDNNNSWTANQFFGAGTSTYEVPVKIRSNVSSPASGDSVSVDFLMRNSGGTYSAFGNIESEIKVATQSSEDGQLKFFTAYNGNLSKIFTISHSRGINLQKSITSENDISYDIGEYNTRIRDVYCRQIYVANDFLIKGRTSSGGQQLLFGINSNDETEFKCTSSGFSWKNVNNTEILNLNDIGDLSVQSGNLKLTGSNSIDLVGINNDINFQVNGNTQLSMSAVSGSNSLGLFTSGGSSIMLIGWDSSREIQFYGSLNYGPNTNKGTGTINVSGLYQDGFQALDINDLAANGSSIPEIDRTNEFTAKQRIGFINGGAFGIPFELYNSQSTPANGDDIGLDYVLNNDADTATTFSRIVGGIRDVTSTSEIGQIEFNVQDAGSLTRKLSIRGDNCLFSGINDSTTGSSANVYVDSSTGLLARATSSRKYKTNIQDYDKGLEQLINLRPVYYQSKSRTDNYRNFAGLIAEEVEEAGFGEYVLYNDDGEPDSLNYAQMTSLLINCIKELNTEVQQLKQKLQ